MNQIGTKVGDITNNEHTTEEVIFIGHDEAWEHDMPVLLITYKHSGNMDMHRQTGSQYYEHLYMAQVRLAKRGLRIDFSAERSVGGTGVYIKVIPT